MRIFTDGQFYNFSTDLVPKSVHFDNYNPIPAQQKKPKLVLA